RGPLITVGMYSFSGSWFHNSFAVGLRISPIQHFVDAYLPIYAFGTSLASSTPNSLVGLDPKHGGALSDDLQPLRGSRFFRVVRSRRFGRWANGYSTWQAASVVSEAGGAYSSG